MCVAKPAQLLWALAVISAVVSGCGEKSTPPKTDLTEEEKKQIVELHEQRAQEWGPPKKK
jgi:hypothetical protein